jgi:hypothetical protein
VDKSEFQFTSAQDLDGGVPIGILAGDEVDAA